MEERVGNNREHGLKGEEGVENDSHGNKLGKNRGKDSRGSRITLTFEMV